MPGGRASRRSPILLWERPPRNVGLGSSLGLLSDADLLRCRDGAPYCEKDYQGLFGVKCEACHQFITGKVLEVSDTRAPFRAAVVFLRVRQNHKRGSRSPFCLFVCFFRLWRKESSGS